MTDVVQDLDSQQLAEGLWKTVSLQSNTDALKIASSNALLVFVGNKVSLHRVILPLSLYAGKGYTFCAAAVGGLVFKPNSICSAAAAGQYQVS